MAKVERFPRRWSEKGKSKETQSGGHGSVGEKRPSISKLQQFLTEIKLFTIMRQVDPRSADYVQLKELSEKLSSSEREKRLEASQTIDGLSETFKNAKIEAQNTTLGGLLSKVLPDYNSKVELQSVVTRVMAQDEEIKTAMAEKKVISTETLNEFESNLKRLGEGLGFKENTQEGFELMNETLTQAVELSEVRRHMDAPKVYEAPIKKRAVAFESGDAPKDKDTGERLQMRHWDFRKREKTRERIEDFKTKVREELIEGDGGKGRKLNGTELMERLVMTRERMADLQSLVGNKREILHETIDTLISVETQYRVLLEERLASDLGYEELSDREAMVGDVLEDIIRDAKGGKWGKGGARIKFDSSYEDLAKEVAGKVKHREIGGVKVVTPGNLYAEAGSEDSSPVDIIEKAKRKRDMESLQRDGDLMKSVLDKAGVKYGYQLLMDIRNKETGKEFSENLIKILKSKKDVSGSEIAALKNFIDQVESDKTGIEKEQKKFEESITKGQYGKAYRQLKAYITDVGLRETSSDFQFAILLRDSKYKIGQVNEDIADEFDQWQQSMFIPSLKDITPENANEILPKVWNQGNVDHVMNPEFANAGAMSIQLPDGTRKTWSAAVMYQELQSTRASMTILNAEVNKADGATYKIFLEHLFGEGTHIDGDRIVNASGVEIMKLEDKLWISDFELDTAGLAAGKLQEGTEEQITMAEIIKQSTWMSRRALPFWMYSGEASEHIAHYPKEQLQNANKWAAAVDRMGHGYNSHFGKITGPYEQIAKLNHLLTDLRVYKDTGTMTGAIRENIIKEFEQNSEGVGVDKEKIRIFAKVLTEKLEKRVEVEGKQFVVGIRSREEARLIGNTFTSPQEAWVGAKPWLVAHGIPEEIIPDSNFIQELLTKEESGGTLSIQEQNWAVQAKEFFELCKELKWDEKEQTIMNGIGKGELAPLAKRQNMIMGTNWQPQNMGEFIGGFEFVSVMNPAKYLQGSDPVEFAAKYRKLATEAAGKLPKLFSGLSTAKEIIEVEKLMRSYLPPEVVDDWTEAFTKIDLRANRLTLNPYEVAVTDPKDRRTILDRKIVDDKGRTFWFIGRDGHRIAYKKMFRGAYSEKYWNRKRLRDKDVDIRMAAITSEGMLPREIADEILNDTLGGGKFLDRFLRIDKESIKNLTETQLNRRRKAKMALAKSWRYIRMIPLFDDPGWVAWSFGSELIDFIFKDMGKAAVEGVTK